MAAWKKKHDSGPSSSSGFTKKRKFNTNDSKVSTTEQSANGKKRALKHARQSRRPYFESVLAAKELWNKLRVKTNTPKDNKLIMEELMSLLTGKFNRVAMQHDASRVVQAAIQFGDEDQRHVIVKELCESGNMVELAKVQYAHFVILKLIKYCYKDAGKVKLIVKSLEGHFSKLAVHAVGARVVELLLSMFPPKLTTQLKLEFYGPRFKLYSDTAAEMKKNTSSHPTLSSVIENQPLGKSAALEHVLTIINKGIKKSLFGFAYFQQILREYVTSASSNNVRSLTPSIADHSIHLLSTKPGARVVAECAAYGTPKDRKRILKSLKGYTRSSLMHSDAYIAILRILDVTDDTVIVQKSVLAELLVVSPKSEKVKVDVTGTPIEESTTEEGNKSPLLDLALSETGCKLFLFLLAKTEIKRQKNFDPAELEILHQNPFLKEGSEEIPTSKKNSNTRRVELLQFMKEALVELCVSHANLLLRSRCGSKVIREIFESFPSKKLAFAIAETCAVAETSKFSMLEDSIGHMTIKNMIVYECKEQSKSVSKELSLAHALYNKYNGKLLNGIACSNRGAFVLSAMAGVVPEVKVEVACKVSEIEKMIKLESKSNAGFHALMKAISSN